MISADFSQDLQDVRGLMRRVGRRSVHHVQQQRGLNHLFQRGAECLHQRSRQIADETDRIAEQHLAARGQRDVPHSRIERGKHSCISNHRSARQAIEQRGFSRVRVAHQRDSRKRHRLPLVALRPAAGAHVLEFVAEFLDAAMDSAAIGFQLRFAGTSGADSASQARHLNAASRQAGQQIIQLRQLNL